MGANNHPMNLESKRFRLLEVLCEKLPKTSGDRSWYCLCDCGSVTVVLQSRLRSNHTKSCGCLQHHGTHRHTAGGKITSEYRAWSAMKDRCHNPLHKHYQRYGRRGIVVCERWMHSFENFLTDMGHKPSRQHTLERKDNNRGYSPNNCVWATRMEQSHNRASNRWITAFGITLTLAEWARKLKRVPSSITTWLDKGKTPEWVIAHLDGFRFIAG